MITRSTGPPIQNSDASILNNTACPRFVPHCMFGRATARPRDLGVRHVKFKEIYALNAILRRSGNAAEGLWSLSFGTQGPVNTRITGLPPIQQTEASNLNNNCHVVDALGLYLAACSGVPRPARASWALAVTLERNLEHAPSTKRRRR